MKKTLLIIIAFIAIVFNVQSQCVLSESITIEGKQGYFQTMDSSYIEISKIRKQWFSRDYDIWVQIGEIKNGSKLPVYKKYKFVLDQNSNFILAPLTKLLAWGKHEFNVTDIKLSFYPE